MPAKTGSDATNQTSNHRKSRIMELDITTLVEDHLAGHDTARRFSDSIANSGLQNIGEITWQNALLATEYHPIRSLEQLEDARDWLGEFGCWTRKELRNMSANEINALMLQFIASELQAEDWRTRGNIYRCDNIDSEFFDHWLFCL